MAKTPKFETMLVKLEERLSPQFRTFLLDAVKHRGEKFAVECLIDHLGKLETGLDMELAVEISGLCRDLKIEGDRREILERLAELGDAGAVRDAPPSPVCSLEDLVAASDPIAFGKANGAGDLMILRALREKYDIPFIEALTLLRAAEADPAAG